jgi:hypothetical protein
MRFFHGGTTKKTIGAEHCSSHDGAVREFDAKIGLGSLIRAGSDSPFDLQSNDLLQLSGRTAAAQEFGEPAAQRWNWQVPLHSVASRPEISHDDRSMANCRWQEVGKGWRA